MQAELIHNHLWCLCKLSSQHLQHLQGHSEQSCSGHLDDGRVANVAVQGQTGLPGLLGTQAQTQTARRRIVFALCSFFFL